MVEETEEGLYRCEECGFRYREREVAERCEEYCRTRGVCSEEITAESVERSGED